MSEIHPQLIQPVTQQNLRNIIRAQQESIAKLTQEAVALKSGDIQRLQEVAKESGAAEERIKFMTTLQNQKEARDKRELDAEKSFQDRI